MTHEEIASFAAAFFDAIERGDLDHVAAAYAPGARIWHSNDGAEQDRRANLETLRRFVGFAPERRYVARRLEVFDGGFVHQHVLTLVRRDGRGFSLPACIVCRMQGEQIVRLDEYLDSAGVAALTAAD